MSPGTPVPGPGAVVVIAADGAADEARRREIALAPFRRAQIDAELFVHGPLALASAPSHQRAVHRGRRILCLLEGHLHEDPGGAQDAPPVTGPGGEVPAARLAGAYERRGEAVLPHLRGAFWALLWDLEREQGILVGDQLGERAPHWTLEDGRLICAGELPELLAARRRRPAPDPVALAHWLMLTLAPEGATLYERVRRLTPGHVLELRPNGACPRRYWQPTYREPYTTPRVELETRVRAELERAVGRRLGPGQGAEPAAVLLSGGLDSSAVAALAADRRPEIPAYSAVFPEHPAADESRQIELTTAALGLPSTRMSVRGGSVLAGALPYLAAWQVPPSSPNLFFWTALFARAAGDGIATMLDGEGGDEIFGFSPYLLADHLRAGRPDRALALAQRWPGWPSSPRSAVLARLRTFGVRGALPPAAHLTMRRRRPVASYAPAWLNPGLARQWLAGEESAFAWKRIEGPRWWAYLVHTITRGIGAATVYEQARRRAALAGLEARHPLADVDLVELMLRCPPEIAFDPRHNRPLLRAAMAGALPEAVRLRPRKSFFDVVFHAGLAGADLPALRALLHPGTAELGAYVDLVTIEREFLAGDPARHPRGLAHWALIAWRLATAELWLRSQRDAVLFDTLKPGLEPPRVGFASPTVPI